MHADAVKARTTGTLSPSTEQEHVVSDFSQGSVSRGRETPAIHQTLDVQRSKRNTPGRFCPTTAPSVRRGEKRKNRNRRRNRINPVDSIWSRTRVTTIAIRMLWSRPPRAWFSQTCRGDIGVWAHNCSFRGHLAENEEHDRRRRERDDDGPEKLVKSLRRRRAGTRSG
ncbi:hypothetical protein VTO42DRAFT_6206 [Malbranchea cinnamomea]